MAYPEVSRLVHTQLVDFATCRQDEFENIKRVENMPIQYLIKSEKYQTRIPLFIADGLRSPKGQEIPILTDMWKGPPIAVLLYAIRSSLSESLLEFLRC